MILVDISGIAIANVFTTPELLEGGLNEKLIKEKILISLLGYKSKFFREYGDMVICCDGDNNWRKQLFKHYKANRKKDKEFVDWDRLDEIVNSFESDLQGNFPYRIIKNDNAEADDIIGVLTENFYKDEKVLILSGDKDFFQLHNLKDVKQFCPRKKEFLKVEDAGLTLFQHIVRGDRGDGIPNIRSDSDTFVIKGKRQNTISGKMLESYYDDIPEELLENWIRNRNLISFEYIPKEISSDILKQFKKPAQGTKKKMFNYFAEHDMKEFLGKIERF